MMNWRKALSAFLALPAVKSIEIANLKPNDVIVFELDHMLSAEVIERIKTSAEQIWPGRKVVVLDQGMRMHIAREHP